MDFGKDREAPGWPQAQLSPNHSHRCSGAWSHQGLARWSPRPSARGRDTGLGQGEGMGQCWLWALCICKFVVTASGGNSGPHWCPSAPTQPEWSVGTARATQHLGEFRKTSDLTGNYYLLLPEQVRTSGTGSQARVPQTLPAHCRRPRGYFKAPEVGRPCHLHCSKALHPGCTPCCPQKA